MGKQKILTAMMREEALEAAKTGDAKVGALVQEGLAEQRKRRMRNAPL